MNDITALAATLKRAAQEELMCREASDTSDLWQDEAGPENVLALVEALEKAQQQIQAHERAELTWMNALDLPDEATRNDILPAIHAEKYLLRNANTHISKLERANAAQDYHINQQQDRIDVLEKRNAELGKYAGEMERYCIAYMEWSNKTDWVQGDKRFDVVKPLGKHRADVLREYVNHLESRTVTVKLYDDFQLCHYGTTEDYAKGYIDSQNNFIKWLAAAGIKVKGE
ncbi:hypothetical protein QE95_003941 [Salmonella enterica subsp. salamae]|nr:hypothetical protein [Salmonella enterica subsp. salamae]